MNAIFTATQELIRLVRREAHENTVLVASDDVFEVKRAPSVILQGPVLSENGQRRSLARFVEKDMATLEYAERQAPRLYHLDFDIVVTTATEAELMQFQETVARLYQTHPQIDVGGQGTLNLTEMVPLGGLRRVNLSNLRQAAGRARLEDCPITDGKTRTGKLIRDRVFEFQGALDETRTFAPQEGAPEP